MKLNTAVKLPDGRIGTICYHNLDGYGGVWGERIFSMPPNGFGDELPPPDFMLRKKEMEGFIRRGAEHKLTVECVGEDYEVITQEPEGKIESTEV